MIKKQLAILMLVLAAAPAGAWWNCSWDYRLPVTVSKGPGAALVDYQVRVNLNALNTPPQFNWSLLGSDLRAVAPNDTTLISYSIEQWNATARTAVIWIRVPSIPAGNTTVYLYFGAPPGTPAGSTITTFTEPGLKFHTRNSTVDPNSRATAEAAFAAANPSTLGYGCTFISAYTGVTNVGLFSPPSRNGDFGLFAEVFFEVTPAQAGLWRFRYGADFGRGGGLYVDDIALDEKWNVDLWWANNWNNTSQILQGSINLSAGIHSLRILGFEGCCDGGLTAQFQRPGGSWLALSLANIPLASRKCPVVEPTVAVGPVQISNCPELTVTRTTQAFSDPLNNTTNQKSIPGAVMLNITNVRNSSAGTADSGSLVITEAIPPNMALRVVDFNGATAGPVQFTNGSPPSGLSYTFVTLGNTSDDLAFSNNNGATYSYTPVADTNGTDLAVTNIRINPKNVFLGSAGAGDPQANFAFKLVVQ
ncbi:MAG: CCXG family PEP-CTERM protein [Gammaproteobacteria bacterium]|nr:CCXG family PEP-CTERM protein [Gammaproteobacteria bacterium]MDH4316643.1 CCXG family PEP-CTERM protein [Gammaproteobacteria bacterium]MDH5214117.1 CCXG family PEP-CTERM protein [Gammaproteobacteria bacterium]